MAPFDIRRTFLTMASITVMAVLLCYVPRPAVAGSPTDRYDQFKARHQEYLQALERFGAQAPETRKAFDGYLGAYHQYKEARVRALEERVNNIDTTRLARLVDAGDPVLLLGRPNGSSWKNPSVNKGKVGDAQNGVDHFVVVSRRDGDRWLVNDPALRTPIWVSTKELEEFRKQSTQGRLAMVARS